MTRPSGENFSKSARQHSSTRLASRALTRTASKFTAPILNEVKAQFGVMFFMSGENTQIMMFCSISATPKVSSIEPSGERSTACWIRKR